MLVEVFNLFIFALLLALLEVQVEGRDGWARNLPTWRPAADRWYVKLYQRLMDKREMTGYHLAIFALVLFVLHSIYLAGRKWSLGGEFEILSDFFLVAVVWDFLWFVVNPYYGWRKFKPAFIAWHKSWLGPWPVSYLWGIFFSWLLFVFSSAHLIEGTIFWLQKFLLLLSLLVLTVAVRYLIDFKKR